MHWSAVGVWEALRFKLEKATVASWTLASCSAYEGGGELFEAFAEPGNPFGRPGLPSVSL